MNEFETLVKSFEPTGYWQWLRKEGIPVVIGHGMEDVRELELQPWPRTGGKGTFYSPLRDGGDYWDVCS